MDELGGATYKHPNVYDALCRVFFVQLIYSTSWKGLKAVELTVRRTASTYALVVLLSRRMYVVVATHVSSSAPCS